MCSTRPCKNGKIVSSNSYFCLYMRCRMPDFVGGTIVPLPRTAVSVSHYYDYKNPTKRVGLQLVQNGPHHHLIENNLFSPWYIWKIGELALLNNHSLTYSLRVFIWFDPSQYLPIVSIAYQWLIFWPMLIYMELNCKLIFWGVLLKAEDGKWNGNVKKCSNGLNLFKVSEWLLVNANSAEKQQIPIT
jgi:hypothetical protein